jgi:RNA polymerase sigma factor (TIGR02999 family)
MTPDETSLPAPASADELIPMLYQELRGLARRHVGQEQPQTLSGTALVHEAWLRLAREDNPRWKSRRHFYNAAAQAMRWILCERARKKQTRKRGSGAEHVELESQIAAPADDEELLAMNESLGRLAAFDSEAAELIHLRYYVGLTWEEIAELTGSSVRELFRQCEYARAWLRADITRGGAPG